jgi:hypothetical protein
MAEVTVRRPSFAAGEISAALAFRDDLQRHQVAVRRAENMMVLPEGGLTRMPGTRFVLPLKNEAEIGELFPFRFSGSDAYMWVINGQAVRLLLGGGFVGAPFEFAVPWAAADLPNVRLLRIDTRVIGVCAGYQPQLITRIDHTNWTVAPYQPAGGPVGTQNLDPTKTLQASATTGAIVLTANHNLFLASDVGGVVRLDEPSLATVPNWKPNEILHSPDAFIAPAGFVQIGNLTGGGGLAAAFNGNIDHDFASSANAVSNLGFVGLDFGGAPKSINRAYIYGPNNTGFVPQNVQIELTLYASQVAPTHATDGTKLGENVFIDTQNESGGRYIFSRDRTTAWRYVWATVSQGGTANMGVTELQLFTLLANTPPILRRYNGRVYQAIGDGDTGVNPPVHEEGDAETSPFGIVWRFKHAGYGFARIDGVPDPAHANATVISELPLSVVTTPTYRWFTPAWSPRAGWPERIAQIDNRVFFARREFWWLTRPNDPLSLEARDLAINSDNPDTAMSVKMLPPDNGGLPFIEWALAAGVLILGERDRERIIRSANQFDPLIISKIKPVPGTAEGSAPHVPAEVDDGAIFIGRSRKRLHFLKFEALPDRLQVEEVSIASRHAIASGVTHVAWERDPNRLLWVRCLDGTTRPVTFMPAQQVLGWTRRTTQNGAFERVGSIPTLDEGTSDTYFIVRRTIGAQTRRYIEQRGPYFVPANPSAPTAAGAWFLDCALRYQGAPVNMVSGAGHLAGETVAVLADGAMRPDAVVSNVGQVTIEGAPASDILIGKRITAKVKLLPIEVDTRGGTSKGKTKKGSFRVLLDLVESLGCKVRVNGGDWETVLQTGGMVYGVPLKLFSGTVPVSCTGRSGMLAELEILVDHAGPFTLAGAAVELDVGQDANEAAELSANV